MRMGGCENGGVRVHEDTSVGRVRCEGEGLG